MNLLHEGATRELGAVFGDDLCSNPEGAHKSFQELDSRLSSHLSHGIYFWPLCKLVDGNGQEYKAPDSLGERAEDIEPPDQKWP